MQPYVIPFQSLGIADIEQVGGKNASLGEMISKLSASGVSVPGGFATTADAYRDFLKNNGLELRIKQTLEALDVEDVNALAKAGAEIRGWISAAALPPRLEEEIRQHYAKLAAGSDASFAVRSSATAEDLPDASFAGQQETFLNIHGIDNILHAIREVFASLYNDRAISYRVHTGYTDSSVALSAGVQRMVRSDLGASGVMFTMDTESGFRDVVFITSSYGLGEMVVQGAVNPDEFYVHKQQAGRGLSRAGAPQHRFQTAAHGVPRRPCRRAFHQHRGSPPASSATVFRWATRTCWSWQGMRWPSSSITAGRWISNGARTASTASSTSCRRVRKRCSPRSLRAVRKNSA